MKALSTIGFVISTLCLLGALYLQFILAPAAAYFKMLREDIGDPEIDYSIQNAALEAKVNMGECVLIGGGVAFLLCLFGSIKTKSKLAMAGALLGLVSLVIGLIHGTHMFS